MDTEVASLTESLHQAEEEVLKNFGQLTESQLNWRAKPDTWSIGQCLDHIIILNRLYFSRFNAVINGDHTPNIWSRIPGLPRRMGKMLIKASLPQNSQKITTPKIFRPTKTHIRADIVDQFHTNQQEMIDYYQQLGQIDVDHTVISSPASPLFVFSLKACLTALVYHEQRHINQAMRVKDELPDILND